MSELNSTEHKLLRADAARRIRTAPAGTKFYAHISLNIAIVDDHMYRGGSRQSISLTRVQAERMCKDFFNDKRESEGCRVPLTISKRPAEGFLGEYIAYWIG